MSGIPPTVAGTLVASEGRRGMRRWRQRTPEVRPDYRLRMKPKPTHAMAIAPGAGTTLPVRR